MPNLKGLMDSRLIKESLSLGTMVNVGFGVMQYRDEREQGKSVLGAASTAVAESIMIDVVGLPVYIGTQVVAGAGKAAIKGYEYLGRQSRSMSKSAINAPFQNANFVDSQQAYTMRQAGMQLARNSKHNLQNAMMGNEAQYIKI